MKRYFNYTYSRIQRPGERKKTIKTDIKIGPVSLKFLTVIILTILTMLYFAQSNSGATKGYELKELENRQEKLEQENERLKVEAARLRSIKEIEKEAKKKKMVPVEKVEYLK